ncbi:MAG: tetratricopeptide repeat protein [Pseudomonadales bacterium]|nr:tetratricopeptide repeat protein [Pseudomonadales bacterium]
MISMISKMQRADRLFLCALLSFLLAGCATYPAAPPGVLPALKNIQTITVPQQDTLAVSTEMKRFVEKYVNRQQSPEQRLRLLTQAVVHPGMLGFEYDAGQTLTAQRAFEKGAGNCLAFTNMFIALAREAGLTAYYQDARVVPEWDEQNNAYLLAKHINVLVRLRSGDYVVDIGRRRVGESIDQHIVSDQYAKAQYYNNLGVEALLRNQIATAFGYFERALDADSGSDYLWSNLGVLYNRNGQPEQAIWAYHQALRINSRALMAISNLASLYAQQGYQDKAQALLKKVEAYRQDNPYYLLMLSQKALVDMRYQEAIKILRKAIRHKDNEHRLHFALAKSFYLAGQLEQAEDSYQRAKELAPDPVLRSVYSKGLGELVAPNI